MCLYVYFHNKLLCSENHLVSLLTQSNNFCLILLRTWKFILLFLNCFLIWLFTLQKKRKQGWASGKPLESLIWMPRFSSWLELLYAGSCFCRPGDVLVMAQMIGLLPPGLGDLHWVPAPGFGPSWPEHHSRHLENESANQNAGFFCLWLWNK